MNRSVQYRLLQIAILTGACVPLLAGGYGMIAGTAFMDQTTAPVLDSHFRYMSGILFAMGLGFWSCVPDLYKYRSRFLTLAVLVIFGGTARLYSALFVLSPDTTTIFALTMELVVVPLISRSIFILK